MAILVTGGAGFIGSHTVIELQNAGYDVVVVDNHCNSSEKCLERVEQITGKKVKRGPYPCNILNAGQICPGVCHFLLKLCGSG